MTGVAVLLITPFVISADSDEFAQGISMVLLMPAIVVGLFLGSRSKNGEFGNFNGSCPLTDSQIANAILTNVTIGVLSSALVWAAFMAAVFFILRPSIDLTLLQSEIQSIDASRLFGAAIRLLGLVILGFGAIWGTVGLMTSLILAGKKVGVVVVCIVIGGWILGGIGAELLLPQEARATFRRALLFPYIVLPAVVFVASWKLRLISRNMLALAASIVVAMFAAAYLFSGFTSEPDALLPILWGCCMTPLALAAAPLAVWWNRHR